MNCHVDKPYPKIRVTKKSRNLANILSHLYASNEGEINAIHQYVYETLLIEDNEIKKIMKDISIVEMHHLEMLGKTISLLGNTPILADTSYSCVTYWDTNSVYYDTDLVTMMEINIEQEQIAIQNYQMVLHVIDDIFVKELIQRILEDEYLHLEIFAKIRKNL